MDMNAATWTAVVFLLCAALTAIVLLTGAVVDWWRHREDPVPVDGWLPAAGDPVHWVEGDYVGDGAVDRGWYFWDEAWAYRVGPWRTLQEARAELLNYAYFVDTGHTPPLGLRVLNAHKGRCRRIYGREVSGWGTYKEIWSHGKLYLTRVFITPNVYFHFYHTGDGDPALHDHPWRVAVSFILLGWYKEERLIGHQSAHQRKRADDTVFVPQQAITRTYKRRWFNVLLGSSWHRIDSAKVGTLTLFITWRKFKSWSFMRPNGDRLHWEAYVKEREDGQHTHDVEGTGHYNARP